MSSPHRLAGLPRHRTAEELEPFLASLKADGYTGIWVENDPFVDDPDPNVGAGEPFLGNWRLLHLWDLTLGAKRERYAEWFGDLCTRAGRHGLEVLPSFWMPKLTDDLLAWIRANRPRAEGISDSFIHKNIPCLCTCSAGDGLALVSELVEDLMRRFPAVSGLKVATEDNGALNCTLACPNAHGTTRASHAANLFVTVQDAMHRVRPDSHLWLYPWFWQPGYEDEICNRLKPDYLVVTKRELGAHQHIEGGPGEPIFDSSIVAEAAGGEYQRWLKRVGPTRIADMVAVGTGIDDFFLAAPPYPGRVARRLLAMAAEGVQSFIDFECGGHVAGMSCAAVVAVVAAQPQATEAAVLDHVAARLYPTTAARPHALAGWRAFDLGFGRLPIGLLNGTNNHSSRFGFMWSMCLATPLRCALFGADRGHDLHWFSPYNGFLPRLSARLHHHFDNVLDAWQDAARHLAVAAALDRGEAAHREEATAEAHVLAAQSARIWADASGCTNDPAAFRLRVQAQIDVVERFRALLASEPWLWANNCWHPQRTPLSQGGGIWPAGTPDDGDVFALAVTVMQADC